MNTPFRCMCATALMAIFLSGIGLSTAARGDYFLGVTDSTNDVIKIDPVTGHGVKISSNAANSEDIQTDSQGNLIIVSNVPGISTSASFRTTFQQLDPITFVPTVLATAYNYRFVEGLANVNGVLYGSASTLDSYAPDTSDHLIRIDLATKTFTEVGKFGSAFQNMEDLAYSPKYGLYGVDIGTLDPGTGFHTFHTTPALVKIDINTGIATKIADLPPSSVDLVSNPNNHILSPYGPYLCGLDFSPDGTLYATTFPTHFSGESHLVTIDPMTGAVTEIGDIGFQGIDGIIYVRTVPEPASLGLVACGIVVFGVARWCRSRSMKCL